MPSESMERDRLRHAKRETYNEEEKQEEKETTRVVKTSSAESQKGAIATDFVQR